MYNLITTKKQEKRPQEAPRTGTPGSISAY